MEREPHDPLLVTDAMCRTANEPFVMGADSYPNGSELVNQFRVLIYY